MTDLVLASNNAGKVREFSRLLASLDLSVQPQGELGVTDAEETGLTFVENAILKARHAALTTGLPALADDSGLEVDALNGLPGIYSARYAGDHGNDSANNALLLKNLRHVETPDRTARFVCVLAYLRHAEDPRPLLCQATWEGRVAREAAGVGGFGYDPLFFVPVEGCTAAELSPETKNRISHRALASRELRDRLPEWL